MIAVSRVRLDGAICLALLVATLTAFWPVGQCDFINYDDPMYVVKNKEVQAGITPQNIRWAFMTGEGGSWHPLTWLSHMLTCQLFGLNASAHHWVNLGFHIANTLLLFLTLRLMTGAVWRSAFVAALFALHPLRVESVAWISERKDVLSGFFTMLTLWAYARYAQQPKTNRYLLALAFFALGLMSKPMLVTLPLILLLLDFWPLGRFRPTTSSGKSKQHNPAVRRLLLEKLPFLALALVAGILTFSFHDEAGYIQSLEDRPVETRIPNAIVSYMAYPAKMFWPKNLSVFYPYHEIPGWQTIGGVLLLFGAFALSIRKARTRPYLFVGWLWYFVMLLPVVGLVQFGWHSMADRFTYLPLIGLFVVVAWGIVDVLPASRPFRTSMALGAVVVLLACLAVTRSQLKYWQNSVALFSRALEVTTRNALAHNNLGNALDELGNTDEAAEHFRAALEIFPAYALAHNNLATVLLAQGKYKQAEDHLRTVIELRPAYALAHNNLATVLLAQGKYKQAEDHLRTAIELRIADAQAYNNLGSLLIVQGNYKQAENHFRTAIELRPDLAITRENLGRALALQGKNEEAQTCFVEALQHDPRNASLHRNLANVLSAKGNFPEALSEYTIALKLDPDDMATREALAAVFVKQGLADQAMTQLDEVLKRRPTAEAHALVAVIRTGEGDFRSAVRHHQEALRLKPNSPGTLNNLAWMLATSPDAGIRDGAEAVRLAQKACEQTEFKRPLMVGTLAAAYAEAGRFAEAIAMAEKACTLASESGMRMLLQKNRELLESYRAGQAYHESPRTNRTERTTPNTNNQNVAPQEP